MPLKSVSYPYLSSANMIHFRPRKKLISSAGSSGSSGNRRRLTSRHREFESYQRTLDLFFHILSSRIGLLISYKIVRLLIDKIESKREKMPGMYKLNNIFS